MPFKQEIVWYTLEEKEPPRNEKVYVRFGSPTARSVETATGRIITMGENTRYFYIDGYGRVWPRQIVAWAPIE